MNPRQALKHWQKEGLLSDEKARELEASLDRLGAHGTNRAIVVFATLGAVLVGLGIVLFVSSNWQRMGAILRGAVLLGAYALIVAAARETERRGYERIGEALWFLATLSFGANIFFLAQIFNFTLTFWQGPLVWLLGVLAMGFARGRAVYGHAAAPLLLLFLGWLGGGGGWFMDDQLEFLVAGRGLRPLLPLLGVGLVSVAVLLRRVPAWSFVERGFRAWGLVLLAVPLVIATAHKDVGGKMFEADWTTKQIVLVVVASLLVAAALSIGDIRDPAGRIVLAGAGLLSLGLVVTRAGHWLLGGAALPTALAFPLLVATVFALALGTVWAGFRTANRALVNAGMAGLSVLILIQYFAWSFGLLASSVAFIVGGLVVLGLAFFMERARRRLLARMEAP